MLILRVIRFFEFTVALIGISTQGKTVRVQSALRQNERFCFYGYHSSKQWLITSKADGAWQYVASQKGAQTWFRWTR
ncbi:MAG: hypothetical protein DWI00_11180 [Planctomycetota bacterium]|nr:MAG: hypothetical protein DWI00_11180 [Planctomycetota bacterium]